MGSLDGAGMDPVSGHSIVATGESEWFPREQPFDDHDRLGQALDSGASRIEAQPSLVVFGLHVPGAEAELQPSVAQEIQGRCLARHQHGVAEVIVEDHGADAKVLRGVGGGGERRDRRQEVGQVIRHRQHGVTEALDLARVVRPCGPDPALHMFTPKRNGLITRTELARAGRASELLERDLAAPPGPANHTPAPW